MPTKRGPKTEPLDGELKNRTVSLDDMSVSMLEAVGGGNLSAGIRRAARIAYDTYQRQDDAKWAATVAATQGLRSALSDEQIDRLLSAQVPGGSAARDWFLPHDTERGAANVRDVVRALIGGAKP